MSPAPTPCVGVSARLTIALAGSSDEGRDTLEANRLHTPIGERGEQTHGVGMTSKTSSTGHQIVRKDMHRRGGSHRTSRHGRPFDLPVLMGIMPLFGTRQARFLHEEVPGIVIPKAIFERLDAAGDRAPDEGVAIAEELVEAVRPLVAGAYVIPALGKYELAARVVASATR